MTKKVQMLFAVFAPGASNMLPIVAFPQCFAEELSGGNWFGSGLFENIQAAARKKSKAKFHKTLFAELNRPGSGQPCSLPWLHACKDHQHRAVFSTPRMYVMGCPQGQPWARLHLLMNGDARPVEHINETHPDPQMEGPRLPRERNKCHSHFFTFREVCQLFRSVCDLMIKSFEG